MVTVREVLLRVENCSWLPFRSVAAEALFSPLLWMVWGSGRGEHRTGGTHLFPLFFFLGGWEGGPLTLSAFVVCGGRRRRNRRRSREGSRGGERGMSKRGSVVVGESRWGSRSSSSSTFTPSPWERRENIQTSLCCRSDSAFYCSYVCHTAGDDRSDRDFRQRAKTEQTSEVDGKLSLAGELLMSLRHVYIFVGANINSWAHLFSI